MAKKLHPNTDKALTSKKYSDYVWGYGIGETHWKTKDEIIAWGPQLIDWLKTNNEAICIEEWIENRGILECDYYKYVAKYPELKKYHEVALTLLANRRERGMVYLKYGMRDIPLMKVHGRYRKTWADEIKRQDEDKARLQEKIATAGANKLPDIIYLDKAEATEEVKAKKAKDAQRLALESSDQA